MIDEKPYFMVCMAATNNLKQYWKNMKEIQPSQNKPALQAKLCRGIWLHKLINKITSLQEVSFFLS